MEIKLEPEQEKLKNEIFRKIGRNIVNFQQIEKLLKNMLAGSKISGPTDELQQINDRQEATIHRLTMGQLFSKFLGSILTINSENSSSASNVPDNIDKIWLSTQISTQVDEPAYVEYRKIFNDITQERNELAHNLLSKWNPDSIESGLEIEAYLDQQHEKILSTFNELRTLATNMHEAMLEHLHFVSSDEGFKLFTVAHLIQSQLIAWLIEIAKTKARPDGWMTLSTAALLVRKEIPEEYADLEKKHGHKTLKAAMLATGIFDIGEEVSEKGGIRVLYRIKPGLDLDGPEITLSVALK